MKFPSKSIVNKNCIDPSEIWCHAPGKFHPQPRIKCISDKKNLDCIYC